MKKLEANIIARVTPAFGTRLTGVKYHPLRDECNVSEIGEADFYIGGEICLAFDGRIILYLSWEENAGWPSHFSVVVSSSSRWKQGTLVEYDASRVPLWRDVIGKRLDSAECLGWETTPHVLKFTFGDQTRYIGSSYKTRFGDGDDVFFCDAKSNPDLNGATTIWRSEIKANHGSHAIGASASS